MGEGRSETTEELGEVIFGRFEQIRWRGLLIYLSLGSFAWCLHATFYVLELWAKIVTWHDLVEDVRSEIMRG